MEDVRVRMNCKPYDPTGFVNCVVIIKVTCLFIYSPLHLLASHGVTMFVGVNKRTLALIVLFKYPSDIYAAPHFTYCYI